MINPGSPNVSGCAGAGKLIETIDPTGDHALTFDNIPQTYDVIKIIWCGRASAAINMDYLNVGFNGDVGINYHWQYLRAYQNIVNAAFGANTRAIKVAGILSAANGIANAKGNGEIIIPGYRDNNLFKSITASSGSIYHVALGYGMFLFTSGLWKNTNSISSITITLNAVGSNFVAGSQFVLLAH